MFKARRNKFVRILKENKYKAVMITNPSNLYYYTGFTGGEAFFVMSILENESYMITDSRYYEQVEKECPGISLVKMENKGYVENVKDLILQWKRNEFLSEDAKLDIAIEDTMPLPYYLKLNEICKECNFKVASALLNRERMIKNKEELRNIAKAEEIGDAAFTHILSVLKPEVTEMEIALELEFFMKKQGAKKLSFDTIVASGRNSSMPHAQVTDRKLKLGDFVTMDFGCVYKGYCSDMTRTVAIGNPTDEMKKIYDIVLHANRKAMQEIEEGKPCNEIDAVARNYIKEKGYGEFFGHGLGHGVGLDIHEEPRFSPKCEVVTKENMVITVEPGIYLPNKFGVRIEDLVVVKKDGFESLSHSPKELIQL